MFRDLPDKVEAQLHGVVGSRRFGRHRLLDPMMFDELMFRAEHEGPDGEAAAWLMIGSSTAEDAPWIHEIAMEMYRALGSRSPERIAAARDTARGTLRMLRESRLLHRLTREGDPEMGMMMRHFPEMLMHFLERAESKETSPDAEAKPPRRRAVKAD